MGDFYTFDDAFDFESNINNGPSPGTGYGGFSGDPNYVDGDSSNPLIYEQVPQADFGQTDSITLPDGTIFGAEDTGSSWIKEELDPEAPTQTLKQAIAQGKLPQSKIGQAPAGKGDETATNLISSISKALGPQGMAALITAGAGMLAGGSQAKMLEKKWENDKKMRDEEWARKDAHAALGTLRKMTWGNSKGLLGEAVK